jgi:hypothetical protein
MLFEETVEPATLGLLKQLVGIPELQQFRLVGGTALSLLLGHRKSTDLDFFSDEPFDRELIIYKLSQTFEQFSFQDEKSPRLFFTMINNVKVDFVYTFEKFFDDHVITEDIRFASLEEIIALKMNAIAGRGAKKDFWDLNELLIHYSFDEIFLAYHQRYPNNSIMMVAKSITYFVEADLQIDPECFRNLSWKEIKKNILKKFNNYINNK